MEQKVPKGEFPWVNGQSLGLRAFGPAPGLQSSMSLELPARIWDLLHASSGQGELRLCQLGGTRGEEVYAQTVTSSRGILVKGALS